MLTWRHAETKVTAVSVQPSICRLIAEIIRVWLDTFNLHFAAAAQTFVGLNSLNCYSSQNRAQYQKRK